METRPAPELLLAQLVLSAILMFLVGHATYEGEYPIPEFKYEVHWGRPVFLEEGQSRSIVIREFRAAYTVLLLMAVSSAYFLTNLLLYGTLKLMRDPMPMYKTTLKVPNNFPRRHRRGFQADIHEFRASYTVLLLMALSKAYFLTNLLLYGTLKLMRDPMYMHKTTLILTHDLMFCFLMFICSIGVLIYPGERAVKNRETEILIASGISIFCCVSSGVGVYYSYKLFKGL